MNYMNYYHDYLDEMRCALSGARALQKGREISVNELLDALVEEARAMTEQGKQIFFVGNGASASIAEHFGFDAMMNAKMRTVNFAESAYITAVSNDLSYDQVFLPKLERLSSPGDMLFAISSSGNSPNIIRALEFARDRGLASFSLTGMAENNKARHLAEHSVWVPGKTYGIVESAHSTLMHCWLDMYLDRFAGGRH